MPSSVIHSWLGISWLPLGCVGDQELLLGHELAKGAKRGKGMGQEENRLSQKLVEHQ